MEFFLFLHKIKRTFYCAMQKIQGSLIWFRQSYRMKTGNLTEQALFGNAAEVSCAAGAADCWKNLKKTKNRRFGLDIAAVKNYSIARFVQYPPQ
jgi:hypothetical protein